MKIIPSLLLVFLNVMIIRKVKRTRIAICKNKPSLINEESYQKKRSRNQSREHYISKKDRNLINLFFTLYGLFLICNIPMAIVRIVISTGLDPTIKTFREFRVLSNTLEVVFAASNFYLYCLCNVQIRRKVVN